MSAKCYWGERQNPLDSELEALEYFWNNVAPFLPGVRCSDPNFDKSKIKFDGLVNDINNISLPLLAQRAN